MLLRILTCLVAFACPGAALAMNVYHVGNSLTWDMRPNGLTAIAEAAGHTHAAGYHIRCAKPLNYITANPTDVCVTPNTYGTYGDALADHAWDAVTLQPYPGAGSTLATDRQAILDLITVARTHPANADTRFYVYAAWPQNTGDYADNWLADATGQSTQPTQLSRDYFDELIQALRAAQPAGDAPVLMIPVGEVLYRLDQAMRTGEIPGFADAGDLYRDIGHLNNVGRFAAAMTTYAVLYGQSPVDLTVPAGAGYDVNLPMWPSDQALTPELREAVQTVAWDVVSTHNYTGVVPEPGTLALAGPLLLLMRRRLRQ